MTVADDLRKGLADGYDALSEAFLPGTAFTLCKASDTDDDFDDIYTIESKRFFEWSNYRKNALLEIADDDTDLAVAMRTATHLKVDNDYWVILRDDTVEPDGTSPQWQIFVERFENRRTHYSGL